MTLYLSMNGSTNYLQLPSMTIKKIVIDGYFPLHSADLKMILDTRVGLSNGYVYARSSGILTSAGANFTITNFAFNERRVVEFTATNTSNLDGNGNFTDNTTIFASNTFAEHFTGLLYNIKCYNAGGVLVAHYDMATGTVQDQTGNGNHATLNSGTWLDDTKTYYLQMDGIDDKLVIPAMTATEFLLEMKPRPQTFEQYIAFNTNMPINRNGSNNADQINANYSAVYVDGVQVVTNTAFIKVNTRQFLRGVSLNPTSLATYVYWNGNSSYMEGELYSLKIYNGATLQAEYDFTKGHAQDISGNGRHATLTGGTWVEDTPLGTIITGEASVSANGDISANGSIIVSGSSTISADSSISADGESNAITRIIEADAIISANSSMSGEATLLINGVGNISASSSIIADGNLIINGEAAISADSQVIAEAITYDPSKQIMNKIKLNGQRDYTSKLEGNQESKVSFFGSRNYTIKLEGGIMATVRQNFNMYAEDSKEIVVTVKKEDGTALVLTGATVKWGFDNVVKTTTSGITITNAAGGEFTVKLNPTDTQNKNGIYSHGGTVTDAAGNVSTVIVGEITINKKVI